MCCISGKVNFCSYQFLLMTFLINHYYNKFYDNYIEANNNDYMIKDLINIRNNFLKKKKIYLIKLFLESLY